MRRKVLGFLLLGLVVCVGIVFVELKSGGAPRVASARGGSESLFTAVLGGSPPKAEVAEIPLEPRVVSPPAATDESGRLPVDPGKREPDDIAPEPPREVVHVVRSGDSLTRIAQEILGSREARVVARIAQRNGLREMNAIRVGDELVVPVESFEIHVADGVETLADVARQRLGSAKALGPIVRFNPALGSAPATRPARGTRVFIPR